jgi:hypothetical protein
MWGGSCHTHVWGLALLIVVARVTTHGGNIKSRTISATEVSFSQSYGLGLWKMGNFLNDLCEIWLPLLICFTEQLFA